MLFSIDILIYFCNTLLAGKLEYIKGAASKIHNPATDLLHVENFSLKPRDICHEILVIKYLFRIIILQHNQSKLD